MKKTLAYAVMPLLLIGVLASCDGSSVSVTTSTPASTVKTLSMWISQKDMNAVDRLEAGFNALNPTTPVKINATKMEEGDVGKKYTEDPDNVPDIAHVPGDVVSKLYQSNNIASFSEADVKGLDIPASAMKIAQDSEGVQYGLPFSLNTYFLYYNKSILKDTDVVSLEKIDAACKKYDEENAAKNTSTKSIAFDLSNGWYSQSLFMSAPEGGIFKNGTSATETYLLNGSGAKTSKVVQNFYLNQDKYELGNDDAIKAALQNGCASFISGSWNIINAQYNFGKDNVGMALLPKLKYGTAETDWRTIGDYKSIIVSANSTNKALAKKFAAYMASPEGQKIRFEENEGTTLPTSKSLNADEKFQKMNLFADVVSKVTASNAYVQDTSTKMSKWWDAATAYCNGIKEDVAAGRTADSDLDTRLVALNTALLA